MKPKTETESQRRFKML